MRMQTYQISLSVGLGLADEVLQEQDPQSSIKEHGRAEERRPGAAAFRAVGRRRARTIRSCRPRLGRLPCALARRPARRAGRAESDTAAFVRGIDALVVGIETHMARWTTLLTCSRCPSRAGDRRRRHPDLHRLHLRAGNRSSLLKRAIEKIQEGNFDARVEHDSSDEFGTLARGSTAWPTTCNRCTATWSTRSPKTAELEEKRERLESLYLK